MGSLTLKQFTPPLLECFDLTIAGGECVSLSGASGCGKTRLLRAIADLDPHQGQAFLNETPSSEMSGPEWRKTVGLLPAESYWWAETLSEHFSNLQDSHFSQLGFSDECADWEVGRLSSGEKQRLALIRLLQNQPQVLLLDEPTANLDHENIVKVEDLLNTWREIHGCAVIWVTHDKAQRSRVAQRHLQIINGRLQEASWN